MIERLSREFYLQPTQVVAQHLLGKVLVFQTPNKVWRGWISETEAYLGASDPAAHSYRGVTPRTAVMFGPGGHAYLYFIYGKYWCLNVVTEALGTGHAVLIRSVLPLDDTPASLTAGPGKLCQTWGLTGKQNGLDFVTSQELWIEDHGTVPLSQDMKITPRIGLSRATEKLLRYVWVAKQLERLAEQAVE